MNLPEHLKICNKKVPLMLRYKLRFDHELDPILEELIIFDWLHSKYKQSLQWKLLKHLL